MALSAAAPPAEPPHAHNPTPPTPSPSLHHQTKTRLQLVENLFKYTADTTQAVVNEKYNDLPITDEPMAERPSIPASLAAQMHYNIHPPELPASTLLPSAQLADCCDQMSMYVDHE